MGKYNGAVITTAGQNVISQAISGTELTWLTMKTSSIAIPAGTNIESLTTLSGIEQTSKITDASVYGNNVIQLSARFSNTNIATEYYIQTVGIYGQLTGGSETLIAVMTAVTPDEMPVYDPDAPSAFIFNAQITVQNAQSVTMTVNDTGTATVADLNRKVDIQGGNISSTVVTIITTSSASYPSIAEGDTVAVAAGKVNKNLSDLDTNKLDKTGDASDAKIGSSTASTASYPIPAANDTFKVILGKIIKFFGDIKGAITGLSVSGRTVTYTKADGTTGTITTQDTTYGVVSKTANGLAPKLPNETTTTKYLRQDGSWVAPPNTTYGLASTSANGLLRQLPSSNGTLQWMRGDGTWQTAQNNATTSAAGYVLDARMGKTLNDKIVGKVSTSPFNVPKYNVTVNNNALTTLASYTATVAGRCIVCAHVTFNTNSSTGIRHGVIYKDSIASPGEMQVQGCSSAQTILNIVWSGDVAKNTVLSIRANQTSGASMTANGIIWGIIFQTG